MRQHERKQDIDDLIRVGTEIARGAVGASLGFFTGGPAGAVLGAGAGPLLVYSFKRIGAEIEARLLGPREEMRIGATLAFAAENIKQKLENGYQLRQDGFFTQSSNDRAPADEIVEGILLIAQREYQERKLPFLGNLVANFAFHDEIDGAQANLLLRLAQRISYRQLCLLALFGSVDKQRFGLRNEDYSKMPSVGAARVGLLQEIYDLYSQGMLNASGVALIDLPGVIPGRMNVQGTGALLYNLMELNRIDVTGPDIAKIVSLLR